MVRAALSCVRAHRLARRWGGAAGAVGRAEGSGRETREGT